MKRLAAATKFRCVEFGCVIRGSCSVTCNRPDEADTDPEFECRVDPSTRTVVLYCLTAQTEYDEWELDDGGNGKRPPTIKVINPEADND